MVESRARAGPAEVIIMAGEGTITIQTRARNGAVHIDIKDTGAGIPPEKLKRLFDPDSEVAGYR